MLVFVHMDVTAKQISDWARESISTLSERPEFGTLTAVYKELARISGLSESFIAKFYQLAKPNPTQDTIDQLVHAIKSIDTEKAA